jgi:hypothetical protein
MLDYSEIEFSAKTDALIDIGQQLGLIGSEIEKAYDNGG